MTPVNPNTEYLYTVRVVKTGEIRQAQARGMSGVALMLNKKLDEIAYVEKVRVV